MLYSFFLIPHRMYMKSKNPSRTFPSLTDNSYESMLGEDIHPCSLVAVQLIRNNFCIKTVKTPSEDQT